MNRFFDTSQLAIAPETESGQKYGYIDLTVSLGKAKNLQQTIVRAIRPFDNALVFEGNTNAAGRLKFALPVCAHKTAENYSITVNYNGFPTKTFNVSVTAGQTASKTVQLG